MSAGSCETGICFSLSGLPGEEVVPLLGKLAEKLILTINEYEVDVMLANVQAVLEQPCQVIGSIGMIEPIFFAWSKAGESFKIRQQPHPLDFVI